MAFDLGLDREQLGDRGVGDAVLDPVDDPTVAATHGFGLEGDVGRGRPVVIPTERRIGFGFVTRARQVTAVVLQEPRQEAIALLFRHARKQHAAEHRRLGQHGGQVGVAHCQLLGHDAAGQRVGAGAAELLREGERAQPHLRGLVEHIGEQAPVAGVETVGIERGRLDLLHDEIADGVADLELLGAEMKIVHSLVSWSDAFDGSGQGACWTNFCTRQFSVSAT